MAALTAGTPLCCSAGNKKLTTGAPTWWCAGSKGLDFFGLVWSSLKFIAGASFLLVRRQ
jgi:hypothetical protein